MFEAKSYRYRRQKWKIRKSSFLVLFALGVSIYGYQAIAQTDQSQGGHQGGQLGGQLEIQVETDTLDTGLLPTIDIDSSVQNSIENASSSGENNVDEDDGAEGLSVLESQILGRDRNIPRAPTESIIEETAESNGIDLDADTQVESVPAAQPIDPVSTMTDIADTPDIDDIGASGEQENQNGLIDTDISDNDVMIDELMNEQFSSSMDPDERQYSDIPDIPSLLYFPRQIALIKEFELGLLAPPPETTAVPDEKNPVMAPKTTNAIRELFLSGILYTNDEHWIVWLNGKRLVPGKLPKEIFDLRVNKEFVELVWHDLNTNIVYPVRLRPNQRFNLDSRLFMPG